MNRLSLMLAFCSLSVNALAASWCGPKETDLDQNWDCNTSADFWFRSQGSQIIPYKWFLSLEEANTMDPFASDKNLVSRFGYIAVPTWAQASVGTQNAGQLPIGFASDKDLRTGISYLGFTCAACHTGQLKLPGITEPVIVNGGQGLGDFEKFMRELVQALEATLKDDSKFKRFSTKVGIWPGDLRSQLMIETGRLQIRFNYNSPAGIAKVRGASRLGVRTGNWLDDYVSKPVQPQVLFESSPEMKAPALGQTRMISVPLSLLARAWLRADESRHVAIAASLPQPLPEG